MQFGNFVAFLFFIFYLATGQTIMENKSDCTKLFNIINGDSKDYANSCCSGDSNIKCDNEGYITYFKE